MSISDVSENLVSKDFILKKLIIIIIIIIGGNVLWFAWMFKAGRLWKFANIHRR